MRRTAYVQYGDENKFFVQLGGQGGQIERMVRACVCDRLTGYGVRFADVIAFFF